jgi:hypothetical protein
MTKVCFNGCSLTVGEGFDEQDRDQYIYDRLVSNYFDFDRTNISKPGSSNHTIFMRSASAILQKKYRIIFTQWSALNRLWLYPGPDSEFFINDEKSNDFLYRDLYISTKDKKKLKNLLLLLNHDYHNIIELIDYCKILSELAQSCDIKIVFINGLIPWQKDLCNTLTTDLTNCLSDYTKSILDFENRDDEEIILYFSKLQEKFNLLDQSKWVNIFDSFQQATTDFGPHGHHPGIKSHKLMANRIIEYLKQVDL